MSGGTQVHRSQVFSTTYIVAETHQFNLRYGFTTYSLISTGNGFILIRWSTMDRENTVSRNISALSSPLVPQLILRLTSTLHKWRRPPNLHTTSACPTRLLLAKEQYNGTLKFLPHSLTISFLLQLQAEKHTSSAVSLEWSYLSLSESCASQKGA